MWHVLLLPLHIDCEVFYTFNEYLYIRIYIYICVVFVARSVNSCCFAVGHCIPSLLSCPTRDAVCMCVRFMSTRWHGRDAPVQCVPGLTGDDGSLLSAGTSALWSIPLNFRQLLLHVNQVCVRGKEHFNEVIFSDDKII